MTSQTVGGRTYEFGLTDRLRISRELAGLGQREFADATGISRSSVTNYESGATTPRRPQLIAWAMATGFSLKWLETGVPDPSDDDGGGARHPSALGGSPTGQYGDLPFDRLLHLPDEPWLIAAQTPLTLATLTKASTGLAA